MTKEKTINILSPDLPQAISGLTETLAHEVHDIWSAGRKAEGWRWGPRRDDVKKRHPNLVPYEKLSEADKAYDRNTALGTIRTILSKGFRIEPGPGQAPNPDHTAVIKEAVETGARLLGTGEPLLAYDYISSALKHEPRNVRLRQLLALALARSGAPEPANALLAGLAREGHEDEETLGLLARTHKDLAAAAKDPRAARVHLRRAFSLYLLAYKKHGGYYSGINAASLALLLGKISFARKTAAEVRALCMKERGRETSYWVQATLGEAAILSGDLKGAEVFYSSAAFLARGRYSDLASMWRQAKMLMAHLGVSGPGIELALHLPPVLLFSDRGGAAGLDPAKKIRAEIRSRLDHIGKAIGYACPATAGGLIFLEELAARGCEINAVLPYPCSAPGARLGAILNKAAKVHIATEHSTRGTAEGARYSSLLLEGMARLRAQALETELITLKLPWNRERAVKPAGRAARAFRQEIKALLFADAVGFSKLMEEQIPVFVSRFLAEAAVLADRPARRPLLKNTWGDAIYFVFKDTEAAGLFALDLCERLQKTAWERYGLPKGISMRIALHAGPVFACPDPVIGRRNYVGSHVSRAARIEPVTPPGQVYASQAFAALAAAQGAHGFRCEYVGQTQLPKKYGVLPLYHIKRAA